MDIAGDVAGSLAGTGPSGGMLADYARRKLELADLVRALVNLAGERGDAWGQRAGRRLLARLAEDRFNLAVLGQFSRGKSSLMNALLGADALPTGILPLTAVITTVSYGEAEKVLVQRAGWALPEEIRLGQLAEYVTQAGNPGNEKRVILAEIQLPRELLRLGAHFIDTPGIGSVIAANTATTRRYLPEADAAILVTSFESPLTAAERDFWREIRGHARRVFVVVNKRDLAAPEEAAPVLEAVRAALRDGSGEPEVFAVSARDGLRAKQAGSAEALAASGLPELEAALTDFLRRDKAPELLARAAERALQLGRQLQAGMQWGRQARDAAEAGQMEARLRERMAELARDLSQEKAALIVGMRERLGREFPQACAAEAGLEGAEEGRGLAAELGRRFQRPPTGSAPPAGEEYWVRTLGGLFQAWRARHTEVLDRIWNTLAERERGGAEALAARIDRVADEALGGAASVPPEVEWEGLDWRSAAGRVEEAVGEAAALHAPWWDEILPEGRLRARALRRWLRRLPDPAAVFAAAVRRLLQAAAEDWVAGLDRQLDEQIRQTGARLEGWLAGRTPAGGMIEGGNAEAPEIGLLLDRLAAFIRGVRRGRESGEAGPLLAPADQASAPRAAPGPCPICLRVERDVFDYLARRQYELSVRESEQRRHAAQAGFCPLHTWQFEAVASPQGVCAAYGEFLHSVAQRLRQLARGATSVAALEGGARALLPTAATCPACRIVAAAEAAAAEEARRGDAGAPFCAFHFCSVLAGMPELETARRLALDEAEGFESLAVDMRNYALKHAAVRRQLATEGERRAATSGLALLAGRRGVVFPWRMD